MNRDSTKAVRFTEKYPVFTNFVSGAWNEATPFDSIEEALAWYVTTIPRNMVCDFVDEVVQAAEDKALQRARRDDPVGLALHYGGNMLRDTDFSTIKSGLEKCLREGTYLTDIELQARKRAYRTGKIERLV